MRLEGGCYCGAVRYVAEGEPVLRAQCHCRACQYFSGGAPNLFMLVPAEGFAYTKGAPKTYRRPDKADAVTREFCAVCGTHMMSRRPGLRPVVLKIGTLDDPLVYGGAQKAIFTAEGQPFHLIADGVPAFEGLPPRQSLKSTLPLAVGLPTAAQAHQGERMRRIGVLCSSRCRTEL